MDTIAYTASKTAPSELTGALSAAGFELGPPRPARRTVLDTFDGRLHAAGLRLELATAAASELVLSDRRGVVGRATVAGPPRLAGDLPAGVLRERLTPVLDVRALAAVATVTSTTSAAVRRGAGRRPRATVEVYEGIGVEGGPELAVWAVEVPATGVASIEDILRSVGLEAADGDLVDLAVAAAGVDLRGFAGSPTIPLAPDERSLAAFRRVLANLARSIDANWPGTVDDVDPEFLHDLRVAVRRTRSVLSQGRNVLPGGVRSTYREAFGWLGTTTSPARDLDVYAIEWDTYLAPLDAGARAALEPVRSHIDARRGTEHAALAGVLRSARYRKVMAAWHGWLGGPEPAPPKGTEGRRRIGRVAAERIRAAQEQVLTRGRGIRPGTPGEVLHELRKDAKKLRYLIECFGGLYAPAPRKAFVQRLKALQDNLGEHQDAEVHAAQLHEMAGSLPDDMGRPTTIAALDRLAGSLDARRAAARSEFAAHFADYDTKETARSFEELLASPPRRR